MGITSYKVETLHRNYNTKRKDFVQKVDDIVETVNHRRFWNKAFCSHSRTCCVFNKAARIVAWIGDAGNVQSGKIFDDVKTGIFHLRSYSLKWNINDRKKFISLKTSILNLILDFLTFFNVTCLKFNLKIRTEFSKPLEEL